MRNAFLVFLMTSLCLPALSRAATPPGAEVGKPAPDFTLRSLDGKSHRLQDLRGKVVFVNIWATWCPPCRQEMPSMVRFYEKMRDRGVEILAVSEDNDGEALKRFVEKNGVSFPVVRDQNRQVYVRYRATGVPETHLIDKAGVIRHSVLGPFDWTSSGVLAAVTQLLEE